MLILFLIFGTMKKIFRSKEACRSSNIGNTLDPGNEKMMDGIKIIEDKLLQPIVKKKGKGKKAKLEVDYENLEQMTFYYETAEECMEECQSRCGMCGAWNFNKDDGTCLLHTADSCCGQRGKQENNPDWISGYVCSACWSTEAGTDCHCSLEKRQKGQLGCAGIAQNGNGAGEDPQYTSATSSLQVSGTQWNKDPCKPVPKIIYGKRRLVKRFCKDKDLNPCGRCQDPQRCRMPRRKNCRCRKYQNLPPSQCIPGTHS